MRILDAVCVIGDSGHGGTVPRSLLEQMRQNGVERAVLVPDDLMTAVDNEEGNRFVLGAIEQNPDAFLGFCRGESLVWQTRGKMAPRRAGRGALRRVF